MTFIDLFSGVGTIRMGMEKEGHQCVYSIENDKYKRIIYKIIFGKEPEAGDIKDVKGRDLPRADVWCFGFPCKNLTAMVRGNTGIKGEKSGLFFEVMRLLWEIEEKDKPTYLLIENVKDLLFFNGGQDFLYVLNCLDEAGYDCEWQLLDSSDFGVAQHRERLFIVGHYRGRSSRKVFPIRRESKNVCIQVGLVKGIGGFDMQRRVYSLDGIAPTLNTCNGGNRCIKVYIPIGGGYRIRHLTPVEYWRLQAIDEDIIQKVVNAKISDSRMYNGAGDACTVSIIREIAKRL